MRRDIEGACCELKLQLYRSMMLHTRFLFPIFGLHHHEHDGSDDDDDDGDRRMGIFRARQ